MLCANWEAEMSAAVAKGDLETWQAFRQHRRETEKRFHEQHQQQRASGRGAPATEDARPFENGESSGEHAQSQMTAGERRRSVPLELLAREWLPRHGGEPDTRAYLVERLLPTLVMSLENLLSEVGRRGLEESEGERDDFNPVNLLAQSLMRRNPKYNQLNENSPYCRALNEVSEVLRKEMLSLPDPKLAALRAASQERRERMERERTERERRMERERTDKTEEREETEEERREEREEGMEREEVEEQKTEETDQGANTLRTIL